MRLTEKRLARIPHQPGVYTFTRRGVAVYVGKAADLRGRLAAYMPGKDWKTEMLREATGLTIEPTDSELEALLLEANRIKALQPKYNISSKSGTSFLSIVITDEEFPQVLATRTWNPSGTYFGPFTSAHAVRETLRALRKIFPFRCTAQAISPERRGGVPSPPRGAHGRAPLRSCLYFHLGQCAGTCAGLVTAAQYRRRVITPLVRLLKGETTSARRLLDADHRALLDAVLAHTRVLSVTEKYAADLVELQRVLHLPTVPHRIEGYDISNIHGIEAVGSMVVAIDGEPTPSEYRKFKVKGWEGRSNDVGMLKEVLTRRLAHTSSSRARVHPFASSQAKRSAVERSPGDWIGDFSTTSRRGRNSGRNDEEGKEQWPSPDLVLIDGGKPQLNAVLRVMRRAGIPIANDPDHSQHSHGIRNIRIALLALAKREEEIYLPGQRNPLRLPRNSPALHLLQRVRDEAHRFAIGYHRFRRAKRLFR
ncbi:hypothetical protein HY480_01535 [Candidatus Uhrbacteria bacterium]|nr:hypothetical protein [Candidatus Uhrbacteria bacterium]